MSKQPEALRLVEALRGDSYSLPSNGRWLERDGSSLPNNSCSQAADELIRLHASLVAGGFTDKGGELWKPPLGPSAMPLLERLDKQRALIEELREALKSAKNTLVAFKFQPGPSNAWEEHDEAALQAVDAALAKAEVKT